MKELSTSKNETLRHYIILKDNLGLREKSEPQGLHFQAQPLKAGLNTVKDLIPLSHKAMR